MSRHNGLLVSQGIGNPGRPRPPHTITAHFCGRMQMCRPVMLHKQSWDRVDDRGNAPPAWAQWYNERNSIAPEVSSCYTRGNEKLPFSFSVLRLTTHPSTWSPPIIIVKQLCRQPTSSRKAGLQSETRQSRSSADRVTGDMVVRGQRHGARGKRPLIDRTTAGQLDRLQASYAGDRLT